MLLVEKLSQIWPSCHLCDPCETTSSRSLCDRDRELETLVHGVGEAMTEFIIMVETLQYILIYIGDFRVHTSRELPFEHRARAWDTCFRLFSQE